MNRAPLIAGAAVLVAFAVPASISLFGGNGRPRALASPTPSASESIPVHLTIVTPKPTRPTDQPAAARDLFRLTNAERAKRGLVPLVWWQPGIAETHAQTLRMMKAGRIFHNPRFDALLDRYHAVALGENVGVSDSIANMQAAFMRSREHRDNILTPNYRGFSAWVIKDQHGILWATINFVTLG